MYGKTDVQYHRMRYRRILAFTIVMALICSLLSLCVIASASYHRGEYLCGHVHDQLCGYIMGSEGIPCNHQHGVDCCYAEGRPCLDLHTHNESCGFIQGSDCTYIHEHNESCGFVQGSDCTYLHEHNESCGYDPITDAGCTDVHIHDEYCGYAEASPCTDVHIHDESCGYLEAAPCSYIHVHDASCGYIEAVACSHTHDESCGYLEPIAGVACNHCCEILGFTNHIPGQAISFYLAEVGETYDEICASLPDLLFGHLACAAGDIAIPVSWSCPDFSDAAGTYSFRAQLTNAHCAYAVADDELTADVDESLLPFISVNVPEAVAMAAQLCTCGEKCTLEHINNACPVCAADQSLCLGVESVEPAEAPPVYELEERTLDCYTTDGALISASGWLPIEAELYAETVPTETVTEFVEQNARVLFAYDIKIMLPNGEGAVEYQPTADHPVTVAITPPQPIAAPVEVVHIAEDAQTGTKTPQPVADVTTTTDGTVEFAAEGFSVYIGTVGSGTGITLTPGSGYAFYSDLACQNPISGEQYTPQTIYLQAKEKYTIDSVVIKNEDGTVSPVSASQSGEIWTLDFPSTLTINQIITVNTYVHANGGTITANSAAARVASMFDATSGLAVTDNVSVTGNNGTFIVEVKNNILLKGSIVVADGANVTLTTSGDRTIKRDVSTFIGKMFEVLGTLSLGSGTEGTNNITFHFSNNTVQTEPPDVDSLPTVVGATILDVTVNRDYHSTMSGTLTIDGGAVFSEPLDIEGKTPPVCITRSTESIVYTNGGNANLKLWGGITLQNQFSNASGSYDANTAAGIRLNGGNLYMYGGIIKQCSTYRGADSSDGGGICFHDGKAFFYGGEITQCCADNGSAVALFGAGASPKVYYLGTIFHHNLAGNSVTYPGQACSAYNGAAVRMYDGSMINNKNQLADNNNNANYDLKPSGGSSTIYLFGGTIGKLGIVRMATVDVYNCAISTIEFIEENGQTGTVNYVNDQPYVVTIPDCVATDGSVMVDVLIQKLNSEGEYEDYYSLRGTGNWDSEDSALNLPSGTYKIIVESPSMEKVYTATVTNSAVTAIPTSRTMKAPVVLSRTNSYITLDSVGTGNTTADGAIFYGYSSTNNVNSVPQSGNGAWQSNPTFSTAGFTGNVYFFVKAAAPLQDTYNFGVSTSPEQSVNFTGTASVAIDGSDVVTMSVGDVQNFTITTNPVNYLTDKIRWSVSGQASPETVVTAHSDGSGSVKVSVNETASSFTLKVELLNDDSQPISGASDTVTINLLPYAYIEHTSAEAPTTLTAHLCNGLVGADSYQWQVYNTSTNQYEDIDSATSQILEVDYSYIGKQIRVVITDNGTTDYTSVDIFISPPTLSVSVPLNMLVTIDATGQCTVTDAYLLNYSDVDVYVTDISFVWQTVGSKNADELFNSYEAVSATLKLGEEQGETPYTFTGAIPAQAHPDAEAGFIAAKEGATPKTLLLDWEFSLGAGNYLKLVPTADAPVPVATIIYTVYCLPSSTTP